MKKIIILILTILLCAGFGRNSSAFTVDKLGGIDIHGFLSQGYLKSTEYNYLAHDSKDGSFSYNEMGLNFGKDLTEKLHIGIQLFARDLGDVANNDVTIVGAYADYRWRDWLGLRIGKIKVPYGLYNETRDMDMLRTCIILPQGIYNDLIRDTIIAARGGGIYGNVQLEGAGSIDYQGLVGTIESDLDSGVGKYVGDEMRETLTINDMDIKTAYAGNLKWNTLIDGLALSVTKFAIEPKIAVTYESWLPVIGGMADSWNVKQDDLILSLEYTWNDLYFASEYSSIERETLPNIVTSGSYEELESYYFMSSYKFMEQFEVGAYYSVFYPDKANKSNFTRWQKDIAISLRYDINDNWLIKLEGHWIDGVADVVIVDNPTMSEEDWKMFAVKMTYSF